MENLKHTKGEWKGLINNQNPNYKPMVIDDHGCQIALMNENQLEFEANAKLIAAAPYLLTALDALVMDYTPSNISIALEVIKKATK